MIRHVASIAVAVLLAVAPAGQAAKAKVWSHAAPSHYDKAQFKGAVVSSEGTVRLSRQLRPLTGLDAMHVWDVVEDREGNLYLATGDEGKLFKVAPDGKITVAYESADSQLLCLALAPDGSIYAGTGPGGLVIRVPLNGAPRIVCRTGENYVWSLAFDGSGGLYAGTGPKGRIYRVTPGGQAALYYATRQEHILCLAGGPDGALYAGTDKNGLVYRIESGGRGFVVFHAPQAEVRTLCTTPDGVYAGTSSPRRRGLATGASSSEHGAATPDFSAPHTSAGHPNTATPTAAGLGKTARAGSETDREEHSIKTHAATAPAAGENSIFYIAHGGTARELFREKALVLTMLRQGGHLFVGTGMEGQLFEVDEATKERSEIARLDHGQIHALCRRRDGSVIVGTGDPGKLYVLQDRYAATGTVISEVLDAQMVSRWGALRWHADSPAGSALTVAVRSGNLPDPDETWSDWSIEQTDGEHAQALAPAARYLQYRVTLSTKDPAQTPALHNVIVRYATLNQAPEVTEIEVPDLEATTIENPKRLHIRWKAQDPNEDDLSYRLYLRKEGWRNWVLLEENLDKREYDWDTTTAPSGRYQLKVQASDLPDNAPEDALTAERVTPWFIVSHTPPSVRLRVARFEAVRAVIDADATDSLVRLTSATYSLDGKRWEHVLPIDGLFDSKVERFAIKTDELKPGTHVLVLRVQDAAGNSGTGDLVFDVAAPGRAPR